MCYLPPKGTTRPVDSTLFYANLLEQVNQYQLLGNIIIMGDCNAHCGELSDYIEGVDDISSREVIDHKVNDYGYQLMIF